MSRRKVIDRSKLSGTGMSGAHVETTLALIDATLAEGVNIVFEQGDAVIAAGTNTQTITVCLRTDEDKPLKEQHLFQLAVFDDALFGVPSASGTMDTETRGVIAAGNGTAALQIQTDASGKFSCTLLDAVDHAVYVSCAPSFGSPRVDSREALQVTFTA